MSAEISATEAVTEAAAARAVLLDVREPDEWDRGHSPLAISIPMSQLQARIDEIPGDERLLVVCLSGGRSERVTTALVAAGYDAVNVAGGMLAVSATGATLEAAGDSAPIIR